MIARIKSWTVRLGIVLASFVPVACHSVITSPVLWRHQSSAAFEWNMGLWVVAAALPVIAMTCVRWR